MAGTSISHNNRPQSGRKLDEHSGRGCASQLATRCVRGDIGSIPEICKRTTLDLVRETFSRGSAIVVRMAVYDVSYVGACRT
jgi:hypothetical protein